MNRRLIGNAVLFQIGWAACIFGARHPAWLLLALGCLALHVAWAPVRIRECRQLLKIAACGWTLDSLLLNLGVFDFGEPRWVLPGWLAMLWLLFASTLRQSLAWTASRLWLAALVGALGGPLSYYAGARLADVGLPYGLWPSLALLAILWALLLPALHRVARSPK